PSLFGPSFSRLRIDLPGSKKLDPPPLVVRVREVLPIFFSSPSVNMTKITLSGRTLGKMPANSCADSVMVSPMAVFIDVFLSSKHTRRERQTKSPPLSGRGGRSEICWRAFLLTHIHLRRSTPTKPTRSPRA